MLKKNPVNYRQAPERRDCNADALALMPLSLPKLVLWYYNKTFLIEIIQIY